MIRLTVLLCGGLFVVLLIAGEDKGQVRQGLLAAPVVAQAPVTVQAPTPAAAPLPVQEPEARITEAVFVPAQPVRVLTETAVPAAAADPVQVAPQPDGSLAVVTARSANVRSGPSTGDAVVGRLTAGEEVLIVIDANAVDGWSLVRIEGDGVTGYVASRLLQPLNP